MGERSSYLDVNGIEPLPDYVREFFRSDIEPPHAVQAKVSEMIAERARAIRALHARQRSHGDVPGMNHLMKGAQR